jgi:hypothetical protein
VNASRAVIFAGNDENFTADVSAAAKLYHNEMSSYF